MKKIISVILLLGIFLCLPGCNIQIIIADENQTETTVPNASVTDTLPPTAPSEAANVPFETEHIADSEQSAEMSAPAESEPICLLTETTITVYGASPSISTSMYEYNDLHQISQMTHYYNGAESNRQTNFEYDALGNPVRYTLVMPGGEAADYFTDYQYDENSNIRLAETFVYTETSEAYLYSSNEYYYDAQGQVLSHTARNSPTLSSLYTNVYSYFYDDSGLPVKTHSYNQNSAQETVSYIYCDSAQHEAVSLSNSGIIVKKTDSMGNILSSKGYRLGELLQSTANTYQTIGTVQQTAPQPSQEDREIQAVLNAYLSALPINDTNALCKLIPINIHEAAKEAGVEASQYFMGLDYLASRHLGHNIISSEITAIGYNNFAYVQDELRTEILEPFGLTAEKTAVAIVDLELEEEYLTCALMLYRSEGKWYYMTSILCQYADK